MSLSSFHVRGSGALGLASALVAWFLAVGCGGARDEAPGEAAALKAKDAGADAAADADAAAAGDADAGQGSGQGVLLDPRDGQAYPTVQLGEHTWLARNLAVAIPGSYCYDDDPSRCEEDGRLYAWSVARTACPAGWHLGSDAEWKDLESAVGMASDQLDLEGYDTVRGTDEGTTLKSATGFAASAMAGFRSDGAYYARGDRTYFWTATTRGTEVWRRRITAADPTVFRFTNPPDGFAISVRCVMNP